MVEHSFRKAEVVGSIPTIGFFTSPVCHSNCFICITTYNRAMGKTRALVYHNLSTMLDAGVPITRSLPTAVDGLRGSDAKVFESIAKQISAGHSLTESMEKFKTVFTILEILAVKTGEKSGNLPASLNLLSKWFEFRYRLKGTITSGMMLPVLVFHLAAIIVPLIPQFLAMAEHGFNIAAYIRSVINILALFYVPLIVITAILNLAPKTGFLRKSLDSLILRIPLLGKAVRHLAVSRYCMAFHMLCKAGVPTLDCANTSAQVTGNIVIAELFKGGVDSVRAGNAVSQGFSPKIGPEFLNMWQIGEETGELDNITKRLADSNAENAEFLFKEFANWLPRFVYFLVSIFMIYMVLQYASMVFGAGL